jgi:methylated-DNA-[protein]-cysteine S-methyltransferase
MMTTEPDAAFLAELTGMTGADDAAVAALRARLATRAEREGLLDIAYRTVSTPAGDLLVAATPQGVLKVAWPTEDQDAVLGMLAGQVSPRVLYAPARLDQAARELDEYFAGRRRVFGVDLDFRLAHGFRRTVLDHLPDIGYGSTASYAQVAAAAGRPAAVRAVGTACARNPLPVLIPCHRVIRSDGTLGQYAGGPEVKRVLLELEAA